MEPTGDALRYKLVLGKFRVIKRGPGWFTLDLLTGVKVTIPTPAGADVREGDLLTLYTEVLANAHPSTTSVQ